MNAVIKRADESDLRDLAVLTDEFASEIAAYAGYRDFHPDKQKILEKLPDFLDMPDYAVFIARTPKGHPLGFCTAFEMPVQIREEPYGILDKLYVRRDYRRRKIGRQLIGEARRFIRSRKGKRMQVTLSAFFPFEEAEAFFKAERFYETGGHKRKIAV